MIPLRASRSSPPTTTPLVRLGLSPLRLSLSIVTLSACPTPGGACRGILCQAAQRPGAGSGSLPRVVARGRGARRSTRRAPHWRDRPRRPAAGLEERVDLERFGVGLRDRLGQPHLFGV